MIFTLFSVTSFGVTQLSRVFCGCPQGLKPEVRKEAWKYLLGFYPFDLTDIERMELRESKEKEYWTMKNQWQSFTEDQERRFTKWREVKHLISKPPTYTYTETPFPLCSYTRIPNVALGIPSCAVIVLTLSACMR